MRLLVPPRVVLALRRNTILPLSRAAASASNSRRKWPAAAPAAAPSSSVLLQRLHDLGRETEGEMDLMTKGDIKAILEEGKSALEVVGQDRLTSIVDDLSSRNDFGTLSRLLEQHKKVIEANDKSTVVKMRLVTAVLSAAAHAKSFSSLPPSILAWIEIAVRTLSEPPEKQMELLVWLLAIVRGDLPRLQQLQLVQQKGGGVGPTIEREKTLRQTAMVYLKEGEEERFRSLWAASGTPLLGDEDSVQLSALVHHGLMRRITKGKPDPSMLRWYASTLAANQRTPIPAQPQFGSMMKPIVSALGGRIEKWTKAQLTKRESTLRRWRSDYSDAVMEDLKKALISYLKYTIVVEKRGTPEDLRRLEKLLGRLASDDEREGGKGYGKGTVVVDWLNLFSLEHNVNLEKFLPSHSLMLIGRDSYRKENISLPPPENHRIKTMTVTRKTEKTQEIDDICCIITAVAARGHLLSNDKTRPHVSGFEKYLRETGSFDVGLSRVLRDYLNDAVVTHGGMGRTELMQSVVDHSKAAQWMDKEEKELAFTVASKKYGGSPFRQIDYYSLHID